MSSAVARPVILVRHAHADWPGYQGRDFDRPLTARGQKDAVEAARAISAAGHRPQLLLASSAVRTRQTAQIMADEFGLPHATIQLVDSLYNASAATLEEALHGVAECSGLVMLVAHNPGISELARRLAGDPAFVSFSPADWWLFDGSLRL